MKRKLLIVYLFFIFSILFTPKFAFAEESIKFFAVSLTAHKNGGMTIHEMIQYNFDSNSKHGIYRFIPLVSQVGDLYRVITVHFTSIQRDGKSEEYTVSSTADQAQVKIGNPEGMITGIHTYSITYNVDNGIGSNYSDHDEIYWNVTGNSWNVPILEASMTLNTDTSVLPEKTICYTGLIGSKVGNCTITNTADGKRIHVNSPLTASEGFTVVSSFPVNTFPKSALQKNKPVVGSDVRTFLKTLIGLYLFLNIIVAPLLLYWYVRYKHKKHFGPPTVNFAIPEYPKGIPIIPAEAGTLDTAKLDKNDIVATIFDLAVRKYLRIEEIDKKGSFLGIGHKNTYKLIKLKNSSDLTEFEKAIMSVIFNGKKSVFINDIQLDYIIFPELEYKNFKSLIRRGFYIKNPDTQIKILMTLGVLSTVTLNIILGPTLIFLSRKLHGRTALGDELDWKIDGLKLFLKSMSRNYTWQAERAYVVEQMIPYAIALGCIDQFMKELKILNPDYSPSWYSGSGNFYIFYPYISTSFNRNITTVSPGSSSGFSGGFSGGGAGGGGGGSW